MAVVLAGWIAGYVMAMLSTAALTYLVVTTPDLGRLNDWFSGSRGLSVVPFSVGTTLLWTMAGLALASLYQVLDLESQPDVLGSPSAPFLIGVAALAVMPLPFLMLVSRKRWWLYCAMSGAFLGLFGWLMPILARG